MPALDLSLLFNPGHWFDVNPGAPSAYYWALVLAFVILAVAGGVSYWYLRTKRFGGHTLHARLAEVGGIAGLSVGLWALFLLLMRFLGVSVLSARVLLYVTILGVLGLGAYGVYYYLRLYPSRLAAYVREEERKRFLPTSKSKGRPVSSQSAASAKRKPKRKR